MRIRAFVLLVTFATSAFGQQFVNLSFESADVSGAAPPFYTVPLTNGVPGWQASGFYHLRNGLGTFSISQNVYFNTTDLDQITLGIYNSSNSSPSIHPVFGNYSAYIEADLGSVDNSQLSLAQSGLVPADAQSLRFRVMPYSSMSGVAAQLSVVLGGQPLSLNVLSVQPTYQIMGADISPYANTLAQLRFDVNAAYFSLGGPNVLVGIGLDNITFSSTQIPEPSSVALFAAALLRLIAKAGRQSS
jgi:hypothetical protein